MLLLEFSVFLDKGVDTINHLLYQLDLAVTQPMLVGDVIGDTGLSTGLSFSTSWLKVKSFTASLKNLHTFLCIS